MKKILFYILIAICVLSVFLASCGKKNKGANNDSITTDSSVADSDSKDSNTDSDKKPGDGSNSGAVIIPGHNHSFGNWIISRESTCGLEGEKYRECSCGQKEVEAIEMKKHSYDGNTCTACGAARGSEGIEYTLSHDGSYYFVHRFGSCTDKDVFITNLYNGKPVKYIEEMAFFRYNDMESVTIAEGVETIRAFSFGACENLKTVNLPNSLTTIETISFLGCSSLKTVNFGNGVSRIGESAFRGCVALENVVIPASVYAIEKDAFESCFTTIYCENQDEMLLGENWHGGNEVVYKND